MYSAGKHNSNTTITTTLHQTVHTTQTIEHATSTPRNTTQYAPKIKNVHHRQYNMNNTKLTILRQLLIVLCTDDSMNLHNAVIGYLTSKYYAAISESERATTNSNEWCHDPAG